MFDWFCFVVVCGVRLFSFFFFLEKCILVILRNEVHSLCPILLMGKRQKKKEVQRDFIHQGVEKPHWYQMCSTGSAKLRYREVSVGICVGKMRSQPKDFVLFKNRDWSNGDCRALLASRAVKPKGFWRLRRFSKCFYLIFLPNPSWHGLVRVGRLV